MKVLLLIGMLLSVSLLLGCTPAESQASHGLALGSVESKPEPAAVEPSSQPSVLATPTPSLPSPTEPMQTSIPTAAATATSTHTPLPSPTSASSPPIVTPSSTDTSTPAAAIGDVVANDPVEAGLQLYLQQHCGTCHRLDAAGAQGTLGPPHNGIATTAEARLHDPAYTGTATTPAEYLRESIVNPGVYLVASYDSPRLKMAAFTNLSEAQVDALVQFLLQQK